MKATLLTDLFPEYSFYHLKAGKEIEVIETGLFRNELDMTTYKFYPVEQVTIKYGYAAYYDRQGNETVVYHTTKIDKSRLTDF